jgi:nitronate monooxygenase
MTTAPTAAHEIALPDTVQPNRANRLDEGLRLPVIVAPMFLISSPELVIAAASSGVLGVYPVANARTVADLETALQRIVAELAALGRGGQWALNMIVHPTYTRFDEEIELLERFKPRLVITALGGPQRALDRVHAFGGQVYSDVTSIPHARKAIDAGADGLVLIASGAGGHTGTYSPFAFVDEVRRFWAGPVVLGGAISNARSIRAALTLGADFAYMGTRFIGAPETLVSDSYRRMLVRASLDDIVMTKAITGVPANWLRESLLAANFDFSTKDDPRKIDFSDITADSKAWKNIWGAGQGVSNVTCVESVRQIVDKLVRDYELLSDRDLHLDSWPRRA